MNEFYSSLKAAADQADLAAHMAHSSTTQQRVYNKELATLGTSFVFFHKFYVAINGFALIALFLSL